MIDRLRVVAPTHSRDQIEYVYPASCADDTIQSWHFLREDRPITLCQAARRNQHLILALACRQLAQRLDTLLFGSINKAAGINNQDACIVRSACAPKAPPVQKLAHALG